MSVDGDAIVKPGALVSPGARLSVADGAGAHVSRGSVKLAAALDHFGYDPQGLHALDIGASTGGFTQVLLERGAGRVAAVDVGHGQLDTSLARDPRVNVLEGTDARDLTADTPDGPVRAIVADVSFISLAKALPAALALAAPGCWLVALIKPQFEVGPGAIGKGGIVRDEEARDAAVETVKVWLDTQPGWAVEGVIPSPIKGGGGNIEYLLGAKYNV